MSDHKHAQANKFARKKNYTQKNKGPHDSKEEEDKVVGL